MATMNDEMVAQHAQKVENYETFEFNDRRLARKYGTMYQYDYRTEDGELFSCVAKTLEECRRRRDRWLEKHPDSI